MRLSLAEQLMHSTVRLECESKNGNESTATGFFFQFKTDEGNFIPLIITNKHVIKDAEKGTFVLTRKNSDGTPSIGAYERVSFKVDFEKAWLKHSDPSVDLAAFPLAPLLKLAEKINFVPFFISFDESSLATPES
ncbi:MAG: serine protease, partial [Spirochaetia bacterium]|nr:serine protease [Spirochaetia bacterium]